MVLKLRNELYCTIVGMEIGFFDTNKTGELINRLSADTQLMQTATTSNISMLLRTSLQGVLAATMVSCRYCALLVCLPCMPAACCLCCAVRAVPGCWLCAPLCAPLPAMPCCPACLRPCVRPARA